MLKKRGHFLVQVLKNNMFIVSKRKIFYSISGALVGISILFLIIWGLPLGIDFVGGSLTEITYTDTRPTMTEINNSLTSVSSLNTLAQPTKEKGLIVRSRSLSEVEHTELIKALSFDGTKVITEDQFTSIGPSLGAELKQKAVIAIIISVLIIIIFVGVAFRYVSQPVASWKYGVVAIIALIHDILIPTGLFSLLGKLSNVSANALFVSALLAILGLSVNDTIVVFDRIRENLLKKVSKDFSEVVDISLKATIARSINTSLTTLLVLGTLYILGPDSTKNFALILSVGLIAGTYSSIFLASPLLVTLSKRTKK